MKTSRTIRYSWKAALALGAVLSFGTPAYPQGGVPGYPPDVMSYDSREIAMLPPYCMYTQGFMDNVPGGKDAAKAAHWRSLMGNAVNGQPMFAAMHHYCFGLMKTNRANFLTRTPQYRKFYYEDAIKEFDYVIAHAPIDFVVLPEVLTKKGENFLKLGDALRGIQELEHAIELKPNYWPPYASMSDFYKNTGDLKKARELLEKGLSSSPDAKALQTRLRELETGKDNRKTAAETPRRPTLPERTANENVPRSEQESELPQAPTGK